MVRPSRNFGKCCAVWCIATGTLHLIMGGIAMLLAACLVSRFLDPHHQQQSASSPSEHLTEANPTVTPDLDPKSMHIPIMLALWGTTFAFEGVVKMAVGIIYLHHRNWLPLTRKTASVFLGLTTVCFTLHGLEFIGAFFTIFVSALPKVQVVSMVWTVIEVGVHYTLLKCALESDENTANELSQVGGSHFCGSWGQRNCSPKKLDWQNVVEKQSGAFV